MMCSCGFEDGTKWTNQEGEENAGTAWTEQAYGILCFPLHVTESKTSRRSAVY